MAQFVGALSALGLAAAPLAAAGPVTLDALLDLEAFGAVHLDADGRRMVVERQRPLASLPRYDFGFEGVLRYADLYVGEVSQSGPLTPLLPTGSDAGLTVGGFSPDGRRLAVYRLQGDLWRLGVITIETGDVVWTEVSPRPAEWGRALEWASNDTLIVLGVSDGGLPQRLAGDQRVQAGLRRHWAAMARGEVSFVINEAGPDSSTSPRPPAITLWSVDAASGKSTALAEGDLIDLELSADGRTAAVVLDGPAERPPSTGLVEEPRRRRTLMLLDLQTGERRPAADDIAPTLLTWSPTGNDLLVYARGETPGFLRIAPNGQVRRVETADITPSVPLVDGIGYIPRAGWLGDHPVIFGRRADADRSDWWLLGDAGPVNLTAALSQPGALRAWLGDGLVISDGPDLFLLRPGGALERLGEAPRTTAASTSPAVRALFGPMKTETILVQIGDRVCWLRASERRCGEAPPEPVLAVGEDGEVLTLGDSPDGIGRLLSHTPSSRDPVDLLTLNSRLADLAFPAPHRIQGDFGSGWLYLPEGEGPFPVVAIPYPGKVRTAPPEEMRPGARSAMWTGHPLIAAGYAVLYPDLEARPDPAEGLAGRILSVVDAAAAEAPIDPARVGLMGWSFGGWAVAMAASQSDRFGAVVAFNGPYDRFSVMGTTNARARLDGQMQVFATDNARWLETGQAGMGASYWQDPERYRRNSAVVMADRIEAPVLILSGDMDFGVAQGELLFGALNRLDRRAALITFFGEEHGFISPGNIRQMYAQAIGWFDRYLREDAAATPAGIASDAATPR